MKSKFNLILAAALLLIFIPSVLAVYGTHDSPELSVTLLSQEPDPVEPGQIVKVKFKIENAGKETDQDVYVKIVPRFPFTIYNDEEIKKIGKLKAAATGADAAVVEFRLKVDPEAVEEDTELELQLQMGAAAISYTADQFLINIQTHDAVLDITSVTLDPEQIAPGETAVVSIMVKNLADSLLKDIKFKLELGDSSLPLAPYQSSSERRIAQLETNFQNSLNFGLIASPEAQPGLYKIPVNITYSDEQGNSYRLEDVLAVTIGETPKLRLYIKKSTVQQAGKAGKITFEIANAGSSDLKFVEMILQPSEDYDLVSTTNYYYLGDIDSDDTESEEVDVYVHGWQDELTIPVQLKYADANNKPFQQQFELKLQLYSGSKLKKFGVIPSSSTGFFILLIILIVGGIFIYRKYKKNPEKYAWLIKKVPFLRSKKR